MSIGTSGSPPATELNPEGIADRTTVGVFFGQAAFAIRDRFLKVVAKRRGVLVPSLVADYRHAPEHTGPDDDHPEDEVDLLDGALSGTHH